MIILFSTPKTFGKMGSTTLLAASLGKAGGIHGSFRPFESSLVKVLHGTPQLLVFWRSICLVLTNFCCDQMVIL